MAAKKTASKKSVAKKPAAKKAAKAKSSKASAKKTSAKKSSASKAGAKKASASKAADKKAGAVSSQVHLGHVFALRPRVPTSFKQGDFEDAKRQLADESFGSLPEAARAVAEKALEITHEGGMPRRSTRRR